AFLFAESLPTPDAALVLLLIGLFAYGMSLRFYLFAQRAFGAARTGSVFATAPFIGAVAALALGERGVTVWLASGAALILIGVVLHLTERHRHWHQHQPMEHEHAHTHGDGHHEHSHEVMPAAAHSHWHSHAAVAHSHAHVPDLHHTHQH
ncbi:MAG: DMT family transporter, partial [Proteobacteria bacterium]|nr:DMT family transporter [Pseudomonadota bacterium]